jgi:hypothetical protein
MGEPIDEVATPAEMHDFQEIRPVWELQGHEVCRDVHLALSIAQAVLHSRQERVGDLTAPDSGEALVRELRALGVREASPQTVAMVALVDTAVHRLADVAGTTTEDAWDQLRKDVLVRHCQSPDA